MAISRNSTSLTVHCHAWDCLTYILRFDCIQTTIFIVLHSTLLLAMQLLGHFRCARRIAIVSLTPCKLSRLRRGKHPKSERFMIAAGIDVGGDGALGLRLFDTWHAAAVRLESNRTVVDRGFPAEYRIRNWISSRLCRHDTDLWAEPRAIR